jgi:copper chaperone
MQERRGPEASVELTVFSVPEMTCRHCVRAVSAHLQDVAGVVAVEADSISRTVRVQGTARLDALRSAISEAGYEAVPLTSVDQEWSA